MFKDVASQKVPIFAWDSANSQVKTGDAGNITAQISIDGGASAAVTDTNPTELDAADHAGVYLFDLSQAETKGSLIIVTAVSSTADIDIEPVFIFTVDNARIDRNMDLIESQRGSHTFQGNLFYVSPNDGDTHANGARGGRLDPYNSVQDCHDNAIVDSNHDGIILLADAAAGTTTLTEVVTLSKRYFFIRGPGRGFLWTRSGAGDTITITADGIEISGCQINTAVSGSGNGIQITDADFILMQHLWINDTRGDGIGILRGSNCRIWDCTFKDTGQGGSGQGIDISGTAGASDDNRIEGNSFFGCAGDAIKESGGTTNRTIIRGNIIEGSAGWGVNIGASSAFTVVAGNDIANNSSGPVTDGGTSSTIENNEQWAKATALATAQTDITLIRDHAHNKFTIEIGTPTYAYLWDDAGVVKVYKSILTDNAGAAVTASTTGPINFGAWGAA